MALGLAAAHRRGLIHRDIKPSNIWLEEETDRAKILDFGLARANDGGEQLTQVGVMIGTPAYMSPEQASGDDVDARSDLFSLGSVLYHMATGRRPFAGRDALATMVAVTTSHPPAPRELNPSLPETLNELIVSLLSKQPADRPKTAREVADRLSSIESALRAEEGSGFRVQGSGTEVAGRALSSAPPAGDLVGWALPTTAWLGDAAIKPPSLSDGSEAQPTLSLVGDAHPMATTATPKPPRRRGLVALAAASAAAILLAGFVIVIKNDKGEVIAEVKTNGPTEFKAAKGVTFDIRSDDDDAASGTRDSAIPQPASGTRERAGDTTISSDVLASNPASGTRERAGDSAITPNAEPSDNLAHDIGTTGRLTPPARQGERPLPAMSAMSLVIEPAPIEGVTSWTLETIDHRMVNGR